MRTLEARLDGVTHTWSVDGPFTTGPSVVLADIDDDLTASSSWSASGFTVVDCLTQEQLTTLRAGLAAVAARELESLGVTVPSPFDLESYHHVADDAVHHGFTGRDNCFYPLSDLPVAKEVFEDTVSEEIGRRVVLLEAPARPPSFVMRVVRPTSNDHSPPHRDVWLPHLRNTIAAYLPVAGSDHRSSLPIAPGSHRWSEDELVRTDGNAVANGVRYGVPGIAASTRPIELVRPDPSPGRIMIFSPYLVHGAGMNLGDTTRVSLELRFRLAGSGE